MSNTLNHSGIKGMKWGVRRYQNKDGTLTPEGKKRYNTSSGDINKAAELSKTTVEKKAAYKSANKAYNKSFRIANNKALSAYSLSKNRREANDKRWEDVVDKAKELNSAKKAYKLAKKIEKENYKSFVKARSKEILAGESFLSRLWDRTTGAHKIQAEVEYKYERDELGR